MSTYTGPPMDLGNMRSLGARSVWVECECGHETSVQVDQLRDEVFVPDVWLHLRRSQCGHRPRRTKPDWKESHATGRF